MEQARNLLEPYLDTGGLLFVAGGATRQASVYRGLQGLVPRSPDVVLIHDGARPWVDGATIGRVLDGARKWGACLPVIASADAVKEVDEQGRVLMHMDRNRTFLTQTPQGFDFDRILASHAKAAHTGGSGFIDDGEVYAAYAGTVYTVEGDTANRKITFLHDLAPRKEME